MFGFGRKQPPTEAQVLDALRPLSDAAQLIVRNVTIQESAVALTLAPMGGAEPQELEGQTRAALSRLPGVSRVTVRWESAEGADKSIRDLLRGAERSTIAVASGKGGVGKSTVSVGLAIALAQAGARVGLMDADIYGPNIPMMMGARQLPPPTENRILPSEAYGVKLMSMGFLVRDDQPVIWRGPMLHNALRQFIQDVEWGDLDCLIIDMPPGTGDVQMSLAQSTELTGGVIVTTPQDVALSDVRKGLATFQKLNVPILGIIENMSYFIAPDTGKRYDIFGHGGGRRYAAEIGQRFLGELPIDPRIASGGDTGKPIIVAEPNSPPAQALRDMARQVALQVSAINASRAQEGLIGLGDIPVFGG